MKIFLVLVLMISFRADASTLENFFSSLEGTWKSSAADSYRETTDGEISHSRGTKFVATVTRSASRWSFSEESCWEVVNEKADCDHSVLTYVVDGNELSVEMDGEAYPVDILELDDDYLIMMLSTSAYTFTAVITREGNTLNQQAEMEMGDGTKVYQILDLQKQ